MQVQLGRYQTRNSRIVEIHDSMMVDRPHVPGVPDSQQRVWLGTLFKSDGKTPDTEHQWEDSGNYWNQRGVANQFDLAILVEPKEAPRPVTSAA